MCDHAEGNDPRKRGSCIKCGRVIPSVRNPDYEIRFLREAADTAAVQYGIDPQGFQEQVSKRLAMGQDLYGNSFLEKDLPQEAVEECLDLGAYAVLDAQKQLACEDESGERAWHLFNATGHAAAAMWHLRQARVK